MSTAREVSASKIVHTFTWRMFHRHQVHAETVEEARQKVLAERPSWIPEGTELRYDFTETTPPLNSIAKMNGVK